MSKLTSGKLLEVWGDTVNFGQLLIGICMGSIGGFGIYYIGKLLISANYPHVSKSLQDSYSLLIGMLGCLLMGFIVGKLFKPKREFSETDFVMDVEALVQENHLDLEKEEEYLKTVSPQVLTEMRTLNIESIFKPSATKK